VARIVPTSPTAVLLTIGAARKYCSALFIAAVLALLGSTLCRLCVQLYNNIYPFPLSQTDPAIDPCQNIERSDQPDRGAQPARANQTPACWATCEHQTETGITGQDGQSGPHRISQPIGGHPYNPPVRNRTTGGNRDEAVQGGCTGE
jgi:hypothetical protein